MRVLRRGRPGSAPDTSDQLDQELVGDDAPRGRSRRRYDPSWDDWKRPRRWPGVLLVCCIVLAFLGVVIWHFRPHTPKVTHHTIGVGIKTQPAYVPEIVGAGSSVTSFEGHTSKAGLTFTTNGGLLIMHASCLCTYNFVVTMTDASGDVTALPVDTSSGRYDGTFNVSSPAGRYTLTVVASGPWWVQMQQPSAAVPLIPTPFTYFSNGESVIGPFSSNDKYYTFKFLSFTNGTVYVHVLNLAGQRIATPFLARGFKQQSKVVLGLPNPYYLEMDASGFWNVLITPVPPN